MIHEQIYLLNMDEQQTLLLATVKLASLTGVVITEVKLKNGLYDRAVELQMGNKKELFITEIKNELRNNQIPSIYRHKPTSGQNFLLISQYIPKPLKQQLKNAKYNYLEVAGNCYIQTDDLFIYINDQKVTETRLPADGKLWKTAGLKFLFAILKDPELLNCPYRLISERAGVALGNVGGFLEELKRKGYLKEGVKLNNKVQFLENKESLTLRWAEAFRATLKPKLLMGTFRFINTDDANNWKNTNTVDFKWGGENAGALLTSFLQPQKFTIYTREPRAKLMKMLKLVPDPHGNVKVFERFWNEEPKDMSATVLPLLAYAELITSSDSRNRETAERIKSTYLD